MRYTYGTIVAVTCSILVLAAFWPGPQAPLTPRSVAQLLPEQIGDSGTDVATVNSLAAAQPDTLSTRPFHGSKERIEAVLAKPLPKIDYFQMTFRDVVFDLSKTTGLTMTIDPAVLGVINPDDIIDLQFPENAVSSKTLLQLAFKSMKREDEVGYTIRDNIVLITAKEDTTEVVIYNCRDLIQPANPPGGFGGGFGAQEGGSDSFDVAYQFGTGGFGGGEGFGGAPGAPGGPGMSPPTPEQQLIDVIRSSIEPDNWSETSGTPVGTIQSINGLVVINHTREVHEQVKNLLQLLRDAMQEPGK